MSSVSLIYIHFVHQLPPALAAVLSLEADNAHSKRLVVYKSLVYGGEERKKDLEIINQIISQFSDIDFLNADDIVPKQMSYVPIAFRKKYYRRVMDKLNICAIYFPHDFSSDFTAQTLMQTFPFVKRVCYGDSSGFIYGKEYFLKKMFPLSLSTLKSFTGSIKYRIRRYLSLPNFWQWKHADIAALIVPCQLGIELGKANILQPEKETVQFVFNVAARAFPILTQYIDKLLRNISGEKQSYMLLCSNFTESRFMTVENEAALYLEALTCVAPHNALVVMKSHPATAAANHRIICDVLKTRYRLHVISDEYNRYPVEFFISLLERCQVVSVSTSSILLQYLWGIQVNHVLTDEMIRKYFIKAKQRWMSENNVEMLRLLGQQG